ncbi:MAG: NUDIX hydrolase [Bacteroidales bacterium]|nr:NUDIX hydrolase [Bacteroidales bacterium]
MIYRRNGNITEVLLTKRNVDPFKGYWCIPGGHIELFEKSEDAAIREIMEETGLTYHPVFLCYIDEIFPEMDIHNVVLMHYGTVEGEPVKDDQEVSEIAWFNLEEALKMNLAFEHHKGLEIFADRMKM